MNAKTSADVEHRRLTIGKYEFRIVADDNSFDVPRHIAEPVRLADLQKNLSLEIVKAIKPNNAVTLEDTFLNKIITVLGPKSASVEFWDLIDRKGWTQYISPDAYVELLFKLAGRRHHLLDSYTDTNLAEDDLLFGFELKLKGATIKEILVQADRLAEDLTKEANGAELAVTSYLAGLGI